MKIDALRIGYENQVGYLKLMSDVDIKLFFGYITIQLALANWIVTHPLETNSLKFAMLILDGSLAAVSCMLFWLNHRRRVYATKVLENFSRELGFLDTNNFEIETELQESPPVRPWFWLYVISVVVAAIGVCLIILTAEQS